MDMDYLRIATEMVVFNVLFGMSGSCRGERFFSFVAAKI